MLLVQRLDLPAPDKARPQCIRIEDGVDLIGFLLVSGVMGLDCDPEGLQVSIQLIEEIGDDE